MASVWYLSIEKNSIVLVDQQRFLNGLCSKEIMQSDLGLTANGIGVLAARNVKIGMMLL